MIRLIILVFASIALTGCDKLLDPSFDISGQCYKSEQAAWNACNRKYNGKCRYLGKPFKVCPDYDAYFKYRENH